MPEPTPFFSRVAPLCQTNEWRNWSGYKSAVTYDHAWEREYYAVRNSAGLLDISPLFKYDIRGRDAERLLNRVMTRDFSKCKVGQVMYSPWCAENGDMIHDGNVARLSADHFRLSAADPSLVWWQDCAYGLDVSVEDVSNQLAALALQGPNSTVILQQCVQGVDWSALKYFRLAEGTLAGVPVLLTRTGFTGDLGYELWLAPAHAEQVWDTLVSIGRNYGLLPFGLGVLDMVRVEAGLLLIEVDYISARYAFVDAQRSSPLEAGLGWAIGWDKAEPFIGRSALLAERARGSEWQLVGLTVNWAELERLWEPVGLRPTVVGRGTSRSAVPIYARGTDGRAQIGQATSHLYSPLLKQYLALATIKTEHAQLGQTVDLEMTVEYSRVLAQAGIVPLPFFNPARKRA
ncbi:MAG: aminomethyltransferase family protein [Chloroflexi bacterium]|nr:aminomethyltransferase family protein [Chloroflexota bacterium]